MVNGQFKKGVPMSSFKFKNCNHGNVDINRKIIFDYVRIRPWVLRYPGVMRVTARFTILDQLPANVSVMWLFSKWSEVTQKFEFSKCFRSFNERHTCSMDDVCPEFNKFMEEYGCPRKLKKNKMCHCPLLPGRYEFRNLRVLTHPGLAMQGSEGRYTMELLIYACVPTEKFKHLIPPCEIVNYGCLQVEFNMAPRTQNNPYVRYEELLKKPSSSLFNNHRHP
jgi:hypothetical protein